MPRPEKLLDRLWLAAYDLSRVNNYKQIELKMKSPQIFSALAAFALLFAGTPAAVHPQTASTPLTPTQIAKMPVRALPIKDFKLLTSGTGWVSTGNRLLFTTDNGAHWKDISPPNPNQDHYASVFFHNVDTGWVLSPHSDNFEDWTFNIYYTVDGGISWNKGNIPEWKYDREKGERGLVDHGIIAFADKEHGWLSLDVEGNTMFASSTLLSTSDGGRTWHNTPDCINSRDNGPEGTIEAILAKTDKEVWVVGSPEGLSALYVSKDGGGCFQELSLTAPNDVGHRGKPSYSVPVFEDSMHGYEAATYSGGKADKSVSVLFQTDDDGRTWKSDRTLSNLAMGETVATTVIDSTWILPFAPQGSQPTLVKLHSNDRIAATIHKSSGDFNNCDLSFLTADEGWMNCSGNLSSTIDGGATWTAIAPRVRSGSLNGVLTTDPITPVPAPKPMKAYPIKLAEPKLPSEPATSVK